MTGQHVNRTVAAWPGWLRRILQLAIGYGLTYAGLSVQGEGLDPAILTGIVSVVSYIVGGVTPLDQGVGLGKVEASQIGR